MTMFREMRRFKQALSQTECEELLRREPRGVLALHGEDGYPYALPINQLYLDGKLYFHCAKEGHKLDAIAADQRASFCLMDQGVRNAGEWWLNIRSVIAFGRVRRVTDPQRVAHVARQLGLKHYPTEDGVEEELAKALDRVAILEMTIDHMTGKRVTEN